MSYNAATEARRLMRAEPAATLSTGHGGDGWPYGSLVLVAADHAARPILLISTLAEHTQNILRDERVSLMFDGTTEYRERLTGSRVTVMGRAAKTDDAHARARFIARHPSAAMYAAFGDFAVYRVEPERAHIVAGFGKINWVEKADLLTDISGAAELAEAEADVVGHMNEDHSDAVGLYANVLCGRPGVGWRLTGVDPEGADLARPGDRCRIAFDKQVATAEQARVELVRLVKRARQAV
ncbi:MAG: HugZ family protein [Minwuia sp.]|uniref:HugZ family pyridoxamine 5'-phosphate oxidase n=1 Tax=Minwuia sp. TaxID=2493630 RepID=UPI003A874B7A